MNPKYEFCLWYATYVISLHVIPGPWSKWSSHGRAIDVWSLTHLLWGYIAGKYGISLPWLLAASSANELLEAYLRSIKFMGAWGDPETPSNILWDLIITSLGWAIHKKV